MASEPFGAAMVPLEPLDPPMREAEETLGRHDGTVWRRRDLSIACYFATSFGGITGRFGGIGDPFGSVRDPFAA